MKNIPSWARILVVGLIGLAIGYWVGYDIGYEKSRRNNINSFDACADAGYPIRESFPEVCQTPDGKSFTKSTASPAAINQEAAIRLIKNCQADGTYSLHNGTVGLILKDGVYQPVSNTTESYLRQNENSTCPFNKAAIE